MTTPVIVVLHVLPPEPLPAAVPHKQSKAAKVRYDPVVMAVGV